MMRLAPVLLLVVMPSLLMANQTETLSTQRDTKDNDPIEAAGHQQEATAFWGISNAFRGARGGAAASGPEAMMAIRNFVRCGIRDQRTGWSSPSEKTWACHRSFTPK